LPNSILFSGTISFGARALPAAAGFAGLALASVEGGSAGLSVGAGTGCTVRVGALGAGGALFWATAGCSAELLLACCGALVFEELEHPESTVTSKREAM